VRYSVLCDEAGIILDDGTISRLAEDHYFITTTTGNLDFVQQWLEWWLVGTGWDVHITNLTGGRAAVNVAGPKARDVLAALTSCDLTSKAFPYMACRETHVAEVPALLLRIGFVGETGWEIHFPAEYGEHLWKKLLEAGKSFGIRPSVWKPSGCCASKNGTSSSAWIQTRCRARTKPGWRGSQNWTSRTSSAGMRSRGSPRRLRSKN
jgi:heterotetrameric sarcosine oxidase gamma subunit